MATTFCAIERQWLVAEIEAIGEWVLRSGCRQAVRWMHESNGSSSPAVSINLFSRQFSRAELVVYIREVLDEFELPSDRLQLEITESAIIDVPELAIDVMRRLRDLGIKVTSMTSEPGIPPSPISSASPSTPSRSTRRSSNGSAATAVERRSSRRSSTSPEISARTPSPRASRASSS